MKQNQLKYDIEEYGVTQSLLMKFLACWLECKRYLEGLTKGKLNANLTYGSIWHDLLYALTNQMRIKPNWFSLMAQPKREQELISIGRKELQLLRRKYSALATDPQSVETQIGMIEHLLPYYLHAREAIGKRSIPYIDTDFGGKRQWVSVEEVFRVDFAGCLLTGKFDGIFEDTRGHLWLLETKSMGQIASDLQHILLVNFQLLFYLNAARLIYGKRLRGVIYNIIRRPTHKTTEGFKKAVTKDPSHFFQRFPIGCDQMALDTFRRDLDGILHDFHTWISNGMPERRGYYACTGRKFNCDYLPLCSQNRKDLYVIRKEMFPELVAG